MRVSLVLFTDFHKLFGNHKNQIMSRIMKNMLKESRIFYYQWVYKEWNFFVFSFEPSLSVVAQIKVAKR